MLTDDFELFDERFRALVLPNVHAETLHRGMRWAEGPAWLGAGRYLLWSDIPNDRVLRWDATDGTVSTFEERCGYHNGHTVDREGRLVSCEHGARRISRIEHDGSSSVLAETFEGRRLNSPNDVVVASDGGIWFTDPTYGIDSDYEGSRTEPELDGSHVYRIDPDGSIAKVAGDFEKPNGLAFSPDERFLYIADTGATHRQDGPRHIRRFEVDGARLRGGAVLATCTNGLFDGFRVDEAGNIWTSAGDGVHCLAPDGERIGRIVCDETVANVEFGGPKRNRLFICATTTLRAVYLNTQAARRPR